MNEVFGTQILGSSEYFTNYYWQYKVTDVKTGDTFTPERLPYVGSDGIRMHAIYPPLFGEEEGEQRNLHKLQLLEQERQRGNEYFFKGMVSMAEGYKPIIDFYMDRRFVFTTRQNRIDHLVSIMVAMQSRQFHSYTGDKYHERVSGIVLSPDTLSGIDDYLALEAKFVDMTAYIKDTTDDWVEVDYDDLTTPDQIDEFVTSLFGTDVWKTKVNWDALSVDTKVDYARTVQNYDEAVSYLNQRIHATK